MPQRAKRSTKKKKKKKGNKKKPVAPVQLAGTASTTSYQDGITNINSNNNNVTASAVSSSTSTAAIMQRHVVNKDDDMDRIVSWLKSRRSKIDTKRMKKYMPATVNDLRSGTCDPETLARTLADIIRKETVRDDENLFSRLVERILSSLPDHDLDFEEYDDIAVEMKEDLKKKIAKEFRRLKVSAQFDLLSSKRQIGISNGFDILCRSWAKRFDDRFYDGVKGSFLRNCTAYHEEFSTLVTPLVEEQGALRVALKTVAQSVANGLDREEDTCWQCCAIKPDVKMCSKCKVACFCGNECMTEAWHSWHRKLCCQIRDDYEQYRDSIKSVEDAHVLGALPCGFELNHNFDFYVASEHIVLSAHMQFTKINGGVKNLRGPNMKYFYKNLQRVVQGEWWLWNSTQDDQAEINIGLLVCVGHLLAYDYHGFAESINTNPDTLTVNAMIERGYIELRGFDWDISAKEFLSKYSKSKRPPREERAFREGMKMAGWKHLREKYQAGDKTNK